MPLENCLKFNDAHEIYFKNPISLKNFTIKSKNIMFYNILINNSDLINFIDYEDADQYFDDENCEYHIPLVLNCIKTEHDDIDGYYNNFKFMENIKIDNIKIENRDPDFNLLPEAYLEYDYSEIENEEINKTNDITFKNLYFKFYNKENDDNQEILLQNIHKFIYIGKKVKLQKIDEDDYKFKHIKDNTYEIKFDDEQYKNDTFIFNFNNNTYISSFFPII